MKFVNTLISRAMPKNRFARGVSVLVGGTIGSQVLLVLAAPLLTRLYTPKDFGLLAVFVALLALISVVASLRYDAAIPLPDDDKEAAALLVLSLVTVLVVASLSAVAAIIFRHEIAALLNSPGLADYLYLVPLGAMFVGSFNVLNAWGIRMKDFTSMAKSKMLQSAATVAVQLGAASLGTVALLFAQIIGNAAASISLAIRSLRLKWDAITAVELSTIILVARRYKKFPLYSTWGGLFNTAGSQLPALMFASLFSPAAAGIYMLANRVLEMPFQLLGQAITKVFFSNAAQAHRDGKLGDLVSRIHNQLAHIAMPPTLVLLVAGPKIFKLVFGPEWEQAGMFAQWFAPWLYLVFITTPLSSVFGVLDKQGAALVFEIILLVVRAAAIAAGAWLGDIMLTVALFSLGGMLCWLGNLIWVMQMSGNKWADIWRPSLSAFTWSVALVSPIILTTMWEISPVIWLFSLAIASLLIATRYIYLMKGAWQ